MKRIFIGEGNQKRLVGHLDRKKGIFLKQVNAKIHLFRILNAWGIDSEVFNRALLPENITILIRDLDSKNIYKISAKEFKANEKYFHFKQPRQDHRTQVFCPLDKFETITYEKQVATGEYLDLFYEL